ncbi:VOC family protein [Bacillus salipaludis]|uniref:VOC family protein n=1 Tax=Bacillus salipaludis TaxID=2547811 RepID=A0A4R5VLJ7_9BACI|nr:VOC family protein [Bacillus salipaludis]MDQ6599273.1 VOC family protein [Bacillus salipaludis]TDK58913.1 VOC family protein [Bacillus salipaludis]
MIELLQLDHIVHFINRNPDEAVLEWEKYGLKAIRGGSHINWGTYNSLLYFGLSYIEYLAVENPEVANQSEIPLISQLLNDSKQFEGFGQICFRTSHIVRLKEDLKTKGYHPTEIFEGKRLRDDGVEISWKMLFIQQDGPLPYPFFIQWNQSDQERLEDLKRSGMLPSRQENQSVKSISFVVSNVAQVVADWAQLLGVPIESKNIIKVGRTDLVFHDKKNSEILTNIHKLKGDRPFQVEIDSPIAREPIIVFGDSLK